MSENKLDEVISLIRQLDSPERVANYRGRPFPFPLRCSIAPSKPWNRSGVEERFNIKLPEDLILLWERTSELRLFEDIQFGQWGLVVWGPSETMSKHPQELRDRERDWREGDFFIGRFLAEADRLLIRCNAGASDFGSVLIALPIDPRRDWPVVGRSLYEFLEKYVRAAGDQFWEPQDKPDDAE